MENGFFVKDDKNMKNEGDEGCVNGKTSVKRQQILAE
jgi:hypothetical protein